MQCFLIIYLVIVQSHMDTTSSNMGKGVISAPSGNAADKGICLVNEESVNQAATPSVHGEPLAVVPLTVAKPGEPVAPTPACIRNHPAYKGGWKVLQYPRANGTIEKVISFCSQYFLETIIVIKM